MVTIAEPVLFGRIIDAISEKREVRADAGAVGRPRRVQHRRLRSGGARRRPLAHARRAGVLCESFERVITMPLAWHQARHLERAAHAAARGRGAVRPVARIHAPASVDRRGAGAAGPDRDVARPAHVAGAGDARRRLCRDRPAGDAQDQARARQSVERHYHQVFSHVSDSVSNVAVLQSYNRIGQETRGAARLHARAARRAEPGARLVGAGQRAAPARLDHLDDGRAADRRAVWSRTASCASATSSPSPALRRC